MKIAAFAVAAALALAAAAAADDAATSGAEAGKWTQDLEAATKLAAEKGLPAILKFTGSDWCPWCKHMERQVFSKDEFKRWAVTNVVLVSLDYPRGENVGTVPDAFKERNRKMLDEYGVTGFPTYFVLSPSGERLGVLGASRDATPKKFAEDVRRVLSLAKLSADEREELSRLRSAREYAENARAELEKLEKLVEADAARLAELEAKLR